ncbi:MAG TPA: metalloregulator ArsR/SmtB family transcription factor [Solirubrobacteraceae bacterium]|nr:metalloregulator ArsR/SmtB family transcription factor [Solirubrobacteraceae bacterium]
MIANAPAASPDLAFTALADPTRREIFERVAQQPRSVGELAEGLPVSRPAVSQHLRVLGEAGLVRVTPQGTRRIYRLDPRGVQALRAYLERFWPTALAAFKAEVERPIASAASTGEVERPVHPSPQGDT